MESYHGKEGKTGRQKETLGRITPLILTYNEAPNIATTLDSVRWASRVVVLDSGSTDQTEELCRQFSNVDWYVRSFDAHGYQWEYGIRQTGIADDYVLALDADMAVPPAFVVELEQQFLPGNYAGGITPFEYRVMGNALKGSVYPAQLRVFRPRAVQVTQPGHTQEFATAGPLYQFKTKLIHDDRKPLEDWVAAQLKYSALEMQRISGTSAGRWRDWLRKWGLMPLFIGPYAYLKAGGPSAGAAAARYAYERLMFECLLAVRLLSARLQQRDKASFIESEK
jgi:glycosyltransferase involved in cell wall biosynthesis